jgi:O-acetyl-ADP-ribose deacetylase (regulator of RNase III)
MSDILVEKTLPSGQHLSLRRGDITTEKVDAIVNAANDSLQHGGGVAGAISRRGGRIIQQESDAWVQKHGLVPHESPAYTSAGALPCRYVIHAVGPIWGSGDEDAKLAAAIEGSLRLAEKLSLRSIAFPAISTGIFGFPRQRAARIFFETIEAHFAAHPNSALDDVRILLNNPPSVNDFLHVWKAREDS